MEQPLRLINLNEIERILTFIRQNITKLAEEADKDAFKEILSHLETAKTLADDDRKKMCLYDASIKYANQVAFRLFIEDNLDYDATKTFRAFDTVKTVSEQAAGYTKQMRAREAEITKMQQDYMAEVRPFEIFQAVIAGMSEQEAKQKQEEYLQKQQAALAQQG